MDMLALRLEMRLRFSVLLSLSWLKGVHTINTYICIYVYACTCNLYECVLYRRALCLNIYIHTMSRNCLYICIVHEREGKAECTILKPYLDILRKE